MKISIIIPVLNAQDYLGQTIRSVLNQTHPADEIFVVDNGSMDQSVRIAESFGGMVRVLHERVPNACAARLTGVAAASGDALMFLDADDLLGPNVLEELAAVLLSHPESVACCPWRRYELVDGCWRSRPASCAARRRGQHPLAAWLTGWYHPPCSILWSRRAYRASGGWDATIENNQDGDLMMRALAAGVSLRSTEHGTAYYRRLPDGAVSLSGRRLSRQGITARLTVLERIESQLTEYGTREQFRMPLHTAFISLAADASNLPTDVAERAKAGAARNVPPLPTFFLEKYVRLKPRIPFRPPQTEALSHPRLRLNEAKTEAAQSLPLVSVIIPTYNRVSSIGAALDSVLGQTYGRFEVLVVDDGSDDNTAELVAERKDERIHFIELGCNQGVAAARNRGIEQARGSLIAFLDSDDQWLPEKLERQVRLAQGSPNYVGLFYSGAQERWPHGDKLWIPHARGNVLAGMLHQNVLHVTTSSTLIRREVFDVVGLFDPRLPANEDHDLWTRIATFFEFDFVPEALIIYSHGESQGAGEAERRSQNFTANMSARLAFLNLHGQEADRLQVKHLYHLDCARRHLESPYGRVWRARRHLLAAAAARPRELRLYMWLLFSAVPFSLRSRLASSLGRARQIIPASLWSSGNAQLNQKD